MTRSLLLLLLAFVCVAPAHAGDTVDYARDVKSLLAKHCVRCHGPARQKNDLRLDAGALIIRGGLSGPAIVAGDSKQSRLIKAVRGGGDGVHAMPPKERAALGAKEIALLADWIDGGAKFPTAEVVEPRKRSDHWAFQLPRKPVMPLPANKAWVRNPIDAFVLAGMEKEDLHPSAEADRTTLIRRLSLDLTGLPPSLKEIGDYCDDKRDGAYERVVERLLASPHYGERWGRHWLDLARYADSNGFNIDAPRSIWPYRDWVIDALNGNMPFDQFVVEQLAGDLLPNATVANRVATGFHRNTLLNQEGGIDHEQFRVESVVDRVNTTGAVFLGLTIGCAQCHDHKFDPISQREYYELFAFFNNCDEPALALPTAEQTRQLAKVRGKQKEVQALLAGLDNTSPARQAEWEKRLTPEVKQRFPVTLKDLLDKPDYQRTVMEQETIVKLMRNIDQVPQLLAGLGNTLPDGVATPARLGSHLHVLLYRARVERELAELKKQEPAIASTLVVQELESPRATHIHIKGDFLRKGRRVEPGMPEALQTTEAGAPKSANATRLELARWLVAKENPLTARVFVNRVWQHYFGLGLVETENDFGVQGTQPSHSELLDWLALEFMNRKWSMKDLHRLIVTSATYRQASTLRAGPAAVDPRNRLLARQNRLRLEAEAVRDVALAASGLLQRKIGGPSVFPHQPEGVFAFTQIERNWTTSPGEDRFRRGIYTHYWRSAPHPALMAFDAPDATSTCTRRNRSNTPLQALTLLNDKAFFECSQGLAVRVLKESRGNDVERLTHAFRLCLARQPNEKEARRLGELLKALQKDLTEDSEESARLAPKELPPNVTRSQAAAWTMVARVLLNLDEFITRE